MKTFSIQQDGYRSIKAISPQEAAEKFVKRTCKKLKYKLRRGEPVKVVQSDKDEWAVIFHNADPRVGRQVFLMWDVTGWSFCK